MLKVNRTIIPLASFIGGALMAGLSSIYLIILSLLSIVFIYIGAALLNDIFDVDIDKVSNSKRPFASNKILLREMAIMFFVFSFIGLLLAYTISMLLRNPIFLWLMLIEFFFGVFYSVILSKIFITANGTLGITHGVVPFFAATQIMGVQPKIHTLIILISLWTILFLTYNLKDLKDIEGDKLKRTTIPTIVGLKNAVNVNIAFLSVPLITEILLFLSGNVKITGVVIGICSGIALLLLGFRLKSTNKQSDYSNMLNIYRIIIAIFIISFAL